MANEQNLKTIHTTERAQEVGRLGGVEGSEHDDIGLGHGELGEVAQEG